MNELKENNINISHRELIYLVFIKNNEGKRMLEIGKKMGISKGAFSNTVKTLKKKSLIKKIKVKGDQRVFTLYLDELGEKAYKVHEDARNKMVKVFDKILAKEEKENIVSICKKLITAWEANQ